MTRRMYKLLCSCAAVVMLLLGATLPAEAFFVQQPLLGEITVADQNSFFVQNFGLSTGFISGNAIYDNAVIGGPGSGTVAVTPASPSATGSVSSPGTKFTFNLSNSLTITEADDFFGEPILFFFNGLLEGFDTLVAFDLDNNGLTESFDFIMNGFNAFSVVDFFSNQTVLEGQWFLPDNDFDPQNAPPVPEPSTFVLLGAGLAGLAYMRRRKSQA